MQIYASCFQTVKYIFGCCFRGQGTNGNVILLEKMFMFNVIRQKPASPVEETNRGDAEFFIL